MRYSKDYAKSMLDDYKDELQNIYDNVDRILDDMQLENADKRDSIQDTISELKVYCASMIDEIEEKKALLREG